MIIKIIIHDVHALAALQTFNNALADSCVPRAVAWSDATIARVGELAAKLGDEDLALLPVLWPDRPLLCQKRCAQVLGWARHCAMIEVLLDFVDRGKPEVALAALESLSECNPALFELEQTTRILAAINAMLARPIEPLHSVLLDKFWAALRSVDTNAR